MAEKRAESSPAGGLGPRQQQSRQDERTPCPDSGGAVFEIRVSGHLDDSWSEWLGGLAMQRLDNGEMILSGRIADQAALLGILNKLNGLNLAILSVRQVSAAAQSPVTARSALCDEAVSLWRHEEPGDCFAQNARNDGSEWVG